jgi:hypothetical protein
MQLEAGPSFKRCHPKPAAPCIARRSADLWQGALHLLQLSPHRHRLHGRGGQHLAPRPGRDVVRLRRHHQVAERHQERRRQLQLPQAGRWVRLCARWWQRQRPHSQDARQTRARCSWLKRYQEEGAVLCSVAEVRLCSLEQGWLHLPLPCRNAERGSEGVTITGCFSLVVHCIAPIKWSPPR